jgi:hypothetical protein
LASVTIEVPEDILAKRETPNMSPDKILRLSAAFSLCKQGQLATSQAARLAGLPYADFLEAAALAKIELFPVDLDELKEQLDLGYTWGRSTWVNVESGTDNI